MTSTLVEPLAGVQRPRVDLRHADCREVLAELGDASVDAIVTDPPYELGFMGRAWDASGIAYNVDLWRECLRVLKPGGHLAAFGGTRTYHRMAVAIEDAGFEIRDSLHWLYGSGFPKSLDVGKAIDKAAGAERQVVGQSATVTPRSATTGGRFGVGLYRWGDRSDYEWDELPQQARDHYSAKAATRGNVTAPATPEGEQWQGWGTALKPSHEPIVLARRPLVGTVAANVLRHDTGGLNVDGCRVGSESTCRTQRGTTKAWEGGAFSGDRVNGSDAGRWPPNVVLTHDETCGGVCVEGCPVADLDQQSGVTRGGGNVTNHARKTVNGFASAQATQFAGYDDEGGASRFFPVFRYQAKAPTSERPKVDGKGWPTVKPLALMRWLVRLICPPGGLVLDPFAGTGTTLHAAALEGFLSIGVERDPLAYQLALQRLAALDDGTDEQHDDALALFDVGIEP